MLKKKVWGFLCVSSIFCALVTSCNTTKQPENEIKKTKDPAQIQLEEEYARSTKDVENISYEEFTYDKKVIMAKIDELSDIMKNYDYGAWLKYIDEDSKKYWSQPIILKKASQRLPVKGLQLKNLEDYFKFVFIPARKNHKVEEIRYVAIDNVKAVQVKDELDVVYYNFQKQNDEWMVTMPPLDL